MLYQISHNGNIIGSDADDIVVSYHKDGQTVSTSLREIIRVYNEIRQIQARINSAELAANMIFGIATPPVSS